MSNASGTAMLATRRSSRGNHRDPTYAPAVSAVAGQTPTDAGQRASRTIRASSIPLTNSGRRATGNTQIAQYRYGVASGCVASGTSQITVMLAATAHHSARPGSRNRPRCSSGNSA